MALGTEIDLSPSDIVLDDDPAPPAPLDDSELTTAVTHLDVDRQHHLLTLAVMTSDAVHSLRNKLKHKVQVDFILLFHTQHNTSQHEDEVQVDFILLLHTHHNTRTRFK